MQMRTWLVGVSAVVLTGFASANPTNQDFPLRCGDLFVFTSAVPKGRADADQLDTSLNAKYWDTLGPTATPSVFNAMARSATSEAERRADEINSWGPDGPMAQEVFETAKAAIATHLRNEAGLSAELSGLMTEQLKAVTLIQTSEDYVRSYISHERRQGNATGESELTMQAYRSYQSSCGQNGLRPNAFFAFGSVVLCPGLALGLHDFSASRADAMDAMAYTLGHELGHAIDSSVWPQAYGGMAACYRSITQVTYIWEPGLADEISADHWGALVLAQRLRARPAGPPLPEQVVKIIAYATDGYDASQSSTHPPAQFRVNQTIARHPDMVGLLGCPGAGEPNPTCTLRGRMPPAASG